MEHIILVDENDKEIGSAEKLQAHKDGKLHRAFSIFVFNKNGELLLQQRADSKYHSGGLWTNTCCSHPRVGEDTLAAANRRLPEEMGFTCPLKEIFSFLYNITFDNGLTENELDHVFIGTFDGNPEINREEAKNYKWINVTELRNDIKDNPNIYSQWIKLALPEVIAYINQNQSL